MVHHAKVGLDMKGSYFGVKEPMTGLRTPAVEAIKSVGKLPLLTMGDPDTPPDREEHVVEVIVTPGLILRRSTPTIFFPMVDE